MAWRLISTPLSADRGEVSVFAIVETIIAISISLGIAWHWQTLTHIAVSACVAPLLLLRGKRSVLVGIQSLNFLIDRLEKDTEKLVLKLQSSDWDNLSIFVATIFYVAGLLFFPLMARIFAVMYQIILFPIKTIGFLPKN